MNRAEKITSVAASTALISSAAVVGGIALERHQQANETSQLQAAQLAQYNQFDALANKITDMAKANKKGFQVRTGRTVTITSSEADTSYMVTIQDESSGDNTNRNVKNNRLTPKTEAQQFFGKISISAYDNNPDDYPKGSSGIKSFGDITISSPVPGDKSLLKVNAIVPPSDTDFSKESFINGDSNVISIIAQTPDFKLKDPNNVKVLEASTSYDVITNTEQVGEMLDRFESILGAMATKQALPVSSTPNTVQQVVQLD